jgi:protocatechuate 3,4-dioxygenase beta subunit
MSDSKLRFTVVVLLAFLAAGILAKLASRRDERGDETPAGATGTSSEAAGADPALPGTASGWILPPRPAPKAAAPRAVKVDAARRGAVAGAVLDPEGRPLGRASIRARLEGADGAAPAGAPAGARGAGEAPGASTLTAEDGTYRLADLADGTYAVEAKAPGLRAESLAGIAVRAGEEVRGVDFILERGESIRGLVLSPEGTPVAGAVLEVRALGGTSLRASAAVTGELEGSARTGEDGRASVSGLAPGRKSVLASGAGFRRSEPALVLLEAGAAPEVELRLEKGAFIAGRVTLASGGPAAKVRVEVRAEGGGGPPMMGAGGGARPDESWDGTTDEDGLYRVDGLAGRRFRAIAWPGDPELAPGVRGGIQAGEQNADIVLAKGAGIFGMVVLADKSKREPVAGATVSVGDALTRKSAVTDEAGRFEISPLPPIKLEVRAGAPGKAEVEQSIELRAGERKELTLELAPGCAIEGRVYALVGGAPLAGAVVRAIEAPKGGERGGRRSGGGAGPFGGGGPGGRGPGEEAMVEVLASGADLSEFMPAGALERVAARNAVTDSRGRFEIPDLPAGEYRVYAAHAEHPGAGAAVRLAAPGDRAKVEIGLPDGGGIAGRVTGEDGAPREDASVIAFSFLGKARTARTDAKGRYEMKGVAPGTYFVMLGAQIQGGGRRVNMNQATAGFGFESKSATVEMSRTTEVNFGNEPKALIAGRVVRGTDPVKEQFVQFFPDGGLAGLKGAVTNEEGRFETELVPGKYLVRIENSSESLEVPVGVPRIEREWRLPVGVITGRVVNAAASEVPRGARVSVYKGERRGEVESFAAALGAMAGEARVQEDGTFRVGGLAPGLYTVTSQADGYARARVDGVDVPPDGERAGVELVLEPGGVMKGVVLDEAREPVPGAAIVVVDAAATDLPGGDPPRADAEGRFELKRFLPGRYRVSIITETHAPARQFVDFQGGTLEMAPVLPAGGTLEVRVLDEEGRPVPGATVDLRYPEGDKVITGFIDFIQPNQPVGPDGRLRKTRLPPGVLKVVARMAIPGLPPLEGSAEAAVANRDESAVTVTVRGPR